MSSDQWYEIISKCLPGCDETHEEDCPVPDLEADYWARYFGLKSGSSAEVKTHNRYQLKAFAPVNKEAEFEDD